MKLSNIEGITTKSTPDFWFFYSDTKPTQLSFMKIKSKSLGSHTFRVIDPPKFDDDLDEEIFEVPKGCTEINSDALDDTMKYVSFMRHLVD